MAVEAQPGGETVAIARGLFGSEPMAQRQAMSRTSGQTVTTNSLRSLRIEACARSGTRAA